MVHDGKIGSVHVESGPHDVVTSDATSLGTDGPLTARMSR